MIPANAKIKNPYGYYDERTREFVIIRPDTPAPWINYLGEGRYGGIISNTAGGFSFDRDPKNRRVTRYRYNSIPVDQPGRYIYLRDQETGKFWSPTWQPVKSSRLTNYECRHGAGYTRISSRFEGIAANILYFVPPSSPSEPAPCEVWVVKLKNTGKKPRIVRSFSYVELSFFDTVNDQTNLDWANHILHTRYENGTFYTNTQFSPTTTFFSSSRLPIGWDSDRETFIGNYRDLSTPVVVQTGIPLQTCAPRGNNIASLAHDWTIQPGEEQELIYVLGVTDKPETIAHTLLSASDSVRVGNSFQELKSDWNSYLKKMVVETPDPEMNAMLNVWNPIQCRATLYWSRFVSLYETGQGRGMGTRDSAQDVLGTVHSAPERARENLTTLWKLQFQDGHTWHQVYPLTGQGGPGLASEYPDWPQWFCDDHLWMIIGVCAYLRETGDFAFLDESIPFYDHGKATVWEHMIRAVEFTLSHRGPQGLPRIGFSDWDDTMNIDHGSGKAESVWCAMQFCRAMLDFAELCNFLNRPNDADHFLNLHQEMSDIINNVAWDGEWFARAYDNEGLPIGVQTESVHQINLNTQTWSVLGKVTGKERAEKAMESIHQRLNTPYGLALIHPPYNEGSPRVRGTATYPPGAKENGGIFCHANTWAIIAATQLGWADRAYQYYRQILPFTRTDADLFKVEPYVYCQNICGPTHPQFGYGRNSWLTGTAAWTYHAGTQWILGIRPTYTGLQVSPVIPAHWDGFKVKREFRGVMYDITITRQGTGNSVSLVVDGQEISGNIIPLPRRGKKSIKVTAILHE